MFQINNYNNLNKQQKKNKKKEDKKQKKLKFYMKSSFPSWNLIRKKNAINGGGGWSQPIPWVILKYNQLFEF